MIDPGPLEDLQRFGAPQQALDEMQACIEQGARDASADVLEENWHAVNVFFAMGTQWRVAAGMGAAMHYEGLDYAALPLVLAEHRATPHRQPLVRLMPQLRVMEHAAREQLNRS